VTGAPTSPSPYSLPRRSPDPEPDFDVFAPHAPAHAEESGPAGIRDRQADRESAHGLPSRSEHPADHAATDRRAQQDPATDPGFPGVNEEDGW
jgi:hypothetical protein